MKILVIEDDPSVADILRVGLCPDAHAIDIADNGNDGSFMARTYEYDAILLDHALPGKNGITVCKDIRGLGKTTPIIFLSVTGDAELKVHALDSGADDYITKPFSLSELKSRIRAITRRSPLLKSSELKVHDLILNSQLHCATRKGKQIRLTKKEFALLEYMIRNKGIILSRAMLMEHVWTADSDPFSNTVEAHIRNLRKKINPHKTKYNLIANIPGHGYVIDTPEHLSKLGR
jgi:DNA-binding response OmpR family regulator